MATALGFAEYLPGVAHTPIPVRVRQATAEDLPAILRVQESAGRAANADSVRRAMLDAERLVCLAEVEAASGDGETGATQTAATTAQRGTAQRGTAQHGRIAVVGWAQTYRHHRKTDMAPIGHYLGGVTVDPAWRRRGVAVALTDARMAWIADRATEAFYVVNPANLASIDLHRRWGFALVAQAPVLTGVTFSGGTGLLLRATLASGSIAARSTARPLGS